MLFNFSLARWAADGASGFAVPGVSCATLFLSTGFSVGKGT